jgi:hypothetical protein
VLVKAVQKREIVLDKFKPLLYISEAKVLVKAVQKREIVLDK